MAIFEIAKNGLWSKKDFVTNRYFVNNIEDEELIDPRQDLMLKLIEYKKYKNISNELSKIMHNYSSTHRTTIKVKENENCSSYGEISNEELNLYDIIKTYAHLIDKIDDKGINYEINFEEISVNDQMIFIKNIFIY